MHFGHDKCRYWTSKAGRMLMTYFDVDADGYRTASDSWSIKVMSDKKLFILENTKYKLSTR